jgi:hypothetical protein
MTDPEDQGESFLQRWSRLKKAAEVPPREDSEPLLRKNSNADPGAPQRIEAQSGIDLTAFDPATLPPIESISASSDIRAFLAPGVPEGLKRAALRRAWVTDPAIRDFVGAAESQWDFNKPDGIPGFGSLDELTPELCRMVAGLFSDPPAENTARPLADVHGISAELPSPVVALTPCESDPDAGQSPAQVEVSELALPEHSDDESLQPIRLMQKKTPIPK